MIIKYIDSVPLFSTIKEAEEWGESMGLKGHHIHYSNGEKGYMGGLIHKNVISTPTSINDEVFYYSEKEGDITKIGGLSIPISFPNDPITRKMLRVNKEDRINTTAPLNNTRNTNKGGY
tara:strand:+ start:213 stop:569 length:357 start_codon:yes stop_codon:yes gene_type:complete